MGTDTVGDDSRKAHNTMSFDTENPLVGNLGVGQQREVLNVSLGGLIPSGVQQFMVEGDGHMARQMQHRRGSNVIIREIGGGLGEWKWADGT